MLRLIIIRGRRERRRLVLATELLERLALSLGDENGGKATEQHEEGEDLEDVVQPGTVVVRGGAARLEGRDGALADDGADLAGGGGDTVGGGAVAGWEAWVRLSVLIHIVGRRQVRCAYILQEQ